MGDVLMPRLSDAIAEGTIRKWLKSDGDDVSRGEELAEIETDKATITFEADEAGPLAIVVPEGAAAAVGEVIARIGQPPAEEPPAVPPVEEPPAAPPVEEPAAHSSTAKGEVTVVELSRAQQGLVRRTAEAKATVPEMALSTEVDMESCLREREALKTTTVEGEATPSLEDMVVKATALALRECPRANAAYRDGSFELYSRVNVGIVVPTPETLVIPTIFDADRKALTEIAEEGQTLAARARDGSISPPELSGGTFTVSTLGLAGVGAFQAIINAPQAGILAAGAVEPRAAVAESGELEVRHRMTLTLTCDHRILYGPDAARFLGAIRDFLQNPFEL